MMDTMTTDKKRIRRNHSPELKARILAEGDLPGASVATVAMAHGINANVAHTWRKLAREGQVSASEPAARFLPIVLESDPVAEAKQDGHVAIELHRTGLVMKLQWPLSAADRLSAWTRELLR